MASAVLSYRLGGFILSPIVKYSGSRYGDILHKEKIGGSTVFDLDISYGKKLSAFGMKKLDLSLTVNNLFDREYISIINTSDYQTLDTTYQAGAPRTVYVSVSIAL